MAATQQVQEQVEACAREMMAAFDAIDDSNALSWLDAVESRAVEIGDAIAVELVKRKSADCLVEEDESVCPQCGKLGQYQGQRERPLITRRGATTIAEPKYFCPCCRKAFFPLTQAIGVEVDCPFTPAMLRKGDAEEGGVRRFAVGGVCSGEQRSESVGGSQGLARTSAALDRTCRRRTCC